MEIESRRLTAWLSRLDRDRILAWLGCVGLGARAVVYGLVSLLMLRAAMLPEEAESGVSPTEAFRAIETEFAGRALLLAIGAGLLLYAIWRFQQALLDSEDEGHDPSGLLARGGMAMSGLSYALIGIGAIAVTFGSNSGDGPGMTEQTAAWLLGQPMGRWGLGLGGLALLVIGGIQAWRGGSRRWRKHVDLTGWRRHADWPVLLSIVGRGLLIALIGLFVILAALHANADEARGLAGSLGWLRTQPFGLQLYSASALVLGGYGLYSALQAHCCVGRDRC